MEFLVNEIIILHILGKEYQNSYLLDDLFVNVDLFSRIKLLFKWGLIDKKTKELLLRLKDPRNQLAHSFGVNEVEYKDKNLDLCFNEFKSDLSEALKIIYKLYFNKFKNLFNINELENELILKKIILPVENEFKIRIIENEKDKLDQEKD